MAEFNISSIRTSYETHGMVSINESKHSNAAIADSVQITFNTPLKTKGVKELTLSSDHNSAFLNLTSIASNSIITLVASDFGPSTTQAEVDAGATTITLLVPEYAEFHLNTKLAGKLENYEMSLRSEDDYGILRGLYSIAANGGGMLVSSVSISLD